MTSLSSLKAASEGLRLMRREPKAFVAWIALWLAGFSLAAWAVAAGSPVAPILGQGDQSLGGIARRFGPGATVLIVLFLVLWMVTVVAVYRAVLHPDERRLFYLRLGWDEARLSLLTVVAFLVALLCGGAPAWLLFVVASPFMSAMPAAAREIATAGAAATVWLDIWLGVRLSLIAVETFSERRFHLTAYWPVTGGRFWYLLFCYVLCFLIFLSCGIVFVGLAGLTYETALRVGTGDLARRGGVLALAGVLAGVTSIYWVVSTVLLCACQAYAFRDIVGEGRDGVAPA